MRRRLTRRAKNKRKKQIIIVSTICLLFIMTVGYAAFNTNLSITAKGNLIKKATYAFGGIEVEVVTEGDGLYADEYEDGKYFYKGTNPNNYITFNGELWRIVSVEADGTIKILRNDVLENMLPFDEEYNRSDGMYDSGSENYCLHTYQLPVCNAWVSTTNMVGSPSTFSNGMATGYVTDDSSLKIYLNETYYSSLSDDKNLIVNYNFNIGIKDITSLATQIEGEKLYKWNGKIGLISVSEFIRANSDMENCSTISLIEENYATCYQTNWMHLEDRWFSITPSSYSSVDVIYYFDVDFSNLTGGTNIIHQGDASEGYVRPTVHLNSNITLSGTGKKTDPYQINTAT